MSLPGHPNAHRDVVSTATFVLDAFQQMVKEELSEDNVEPVYDEKLTFESGIKSYLDKNNYNSQDQTSFPVFLFNRSVMRWPKGVAPSRRLNNLTGYVTIKDEHGNPLSAVKYTATQGEFDLQFLYLCRSVEQQEQFEIAYQGETGISANKTIVVDMKEGLGEFNYFLTFSDLTQKVINYEDAAYTAIMGQATVRGLYFVFQSDNASIIKRIVERVFVKVVAAPGLAGDLSGLVITKTIT